MPTTKLRMRLDEFGLKPEFLIAVRAGMSPAALSHLVVGRRRPTAAQLFRLAAILDCEPEDLMGWADEPG